MQLVLKILDEYERPTIFIQARLAALFPMYIRIMMTVLTNTMVNSLKITLVPSLIIH